jgi:dienelactone hydrolase
MVVAVGLLVGAPAHAAVQTRPIEYQDGEAVLEGSLAYDDAATAASPGILVVHEWKGLNDYAKRRARMLAELGYVALAVDMYGKGVLAKDHQEAARLSGVYRSDRALMRRRILAALAVLRSQPHVDEARIGAIGYCFGGTTVLELARSGADVKAVVSFHGGLDSPDPEAGHAIRGTVLVLHGANDLYVAPEQMAAFTREMEAGGVDYRIVEYPGAVHSFTVPEAGTDPSRGMAYDPEADRQSWEEMRRLFEEVF